MVTPYGNADIIFEDEYIIAVSKPHGLHTIDDRSHSETATMKSLLSKRCGKIFVVHRLDAGTGGVTIFAKTPRAHSVLCDCFENGRAAKEYYAITEGVFGGAVSVFLPIGNKPSHGKYKINFKSGKAAATTFYDTKEIGIASLVKAIPLTGRTHQIRVHLKAIKHPLYHDWLYNATFGKTQRREENRTEEVKKQPSADKRLSLFAKKLILPHPISGKPVTLEAELSDFMKETIRYARNGGVNPSK